MNSHKDWFLSLEIGRWDCERREEKVKWSREKGSMVRTMNVEDNFESRILKFDEA